MKRNKCLSIDKRTGKITVKKKSGTGYHCSMVKVTSANVGAYRSVSKTIYVRVKVA